MARGMLSAVGHKLEPQTLSITTRITYTPLFSILLYLPLYLSILTILLSFNLFGRCFTYGPREREAFKSIPLRAICHPSFLGYLSPFLSPPLFLTRFNEAHPPEVSVWAKTLEWAEKLGEIIWYWTDWIIWIEGEGWRRVKSFFCIALGRSAAGGREGRTQEELEPRWSHIGKYDQFIFCTPIPINQDTNLSLSPNRSPYMCEPSHWCSGSSVFEWSPDKANSQCCCGFQGPPLWNHRH